MGLRHLKSQTQHTKVVLLVGIRVNKGSIELFLSSIT